MKKKLFMMVMVFSLVLSMMSMTVNADSRTVMNTKAATKEKLPITVTAGNGYFTVKAKETQQYSTYIAAVYEKSVPKSLINSMNSDVIMIPVGDVGPKLKYKEITNKETKYKWKNGKKAYVLIMYGMHILSSADRLVEKYGISKYDIRTVTPGKAAKKSSKKSGKITKGNGKVAKCYYLNMRTKADTSAKVIKVLKKGTKVKITKTVKFGKAKWYKVKVGKKTGYVYSKYIKRYNSK